MDFKINKPVDIRTLLENVQKSSASHVKYSVILKKAIEKTNNEEYVAEFITCLRISFLTNYKENNPHMDKLMTFFALFFTSFREIKEDNHLMNPFLNKILKLLLQYSGVQNESCRYWSCKLLAKLFDGLEEIGDDLYDELKETLLERLNDTKAAIRFQAIISAYRLQDPTDKNDPFTNHFMYMLEHDPNAKVRHLCVEKIVLNKYVLPFILSRIRDVDDNVRLAAFKKLSPLAKFLTIEEKHLVFKCGFFDKSEKVKKFISENLIQNWLELYENNYFNLMKSVRFDACEDDIKETTTLLEVVLNSSFKSKTLEEIVSCLTLNQRKLFDYENLNWESALYYRIAIQFLKKSPEFEETLEAVLPELIEFCHYIKGYYSYVCDKLDSLEYQFILQQLFLITIEYDVSDSVSRESLTSLVHYILLNGELTTSTAKIIVQSLEMTIPNVKNRSIFVCEIISNIMYGEEAINDEQLHKEEEEKWNKISQLKNEINELHNGEQRCILENNFLEADRIKLEIEDKQLILKNLETLQTKTEPPKARTDIPTIMKYLTIAEALLLSPKIVELNPALATLKSEVIEKILVHDDANVRAKVFKCYALCCIIDKRSAMYGIHLFSAAIIASNMRELCDDQILIICIKAVVDLLSMYGSSLVEKPEEKEEDEDEKKVFLGGTSLTDIIQGLADLLNHEDFQVQEIATKGICVLLLSGRVTSPSLFSLIIIKWANPATDNEKLKQFIGHTLNTLPTVTDFCNYCADGVISAIKTLIYAPKTSPLVDVDIFNIIKFMLVLCEISKQGPQIQQELAFKMCKQMLDKPRSKMVPIYAKILTLLKVSNNKESEDDLLRICDQLGDKIRDNKSLKNIAKFATTLNRENEE